MSAREQGAAVVVEGVTKRYGRIEALRGVDLAVEPGELVALTGRSGSGKSTLLNLVGGLDQPDGGRVLIDGEPVWERGSSVRARRDLVGFVFQLHHLLPSATARANVELPLLGAGVGRAERRRRALELLQEVGLGDRAGALPSELSGGERQRVAIARALANAPRLLLADEPTGALDVTTAARVLELLLSVRRRHGMTAIVVSYDEAIGARADRRLQLLDGVLHDERVTRGRVPSQAGSA